LRKCAEFQNPTLNFRTLLTSSKSYQFLNNAIKVLPVPRFIANAVPDFTMNAGIEKEVSQHDYLPPTPKSADLFD
jgi:hypothetical protein